MTLDYDLFEGVLYRHYKGNLYYAHFVAKHSETDERLGEEEFHPQLSHELLVVYQSVAPEWSIYDEQILLVPHEIWLRPLEHFCSTVQVEGKEVLRFTPI